MLLINVLGKIQNKSDKWKANKIVFDKENNLNRIQDSVIKITIKKIREKILWLLNQVEKQQY